MFKITSCVLVLISLLAGCSGQRHPGEEDLKKQLASIDPELLEVESVTVQYSPMKEVFGTTLPEGSLQAVCKVSAKTRRDLYVEIDPSSAKSTEDQNVVKWQLRARAIDNTRFGKTSRSLEGQELEEFQRVYDRVEKEARGSVLSRRTPAGQMVQFHASILEIPQVDSWKFQLLDSDWQTVRATLGQVQNAFIPMFATKGPPVLGTAEGGAYVESLQSAVEQYEAAESKLTSKYEQALRDSSAALLNLVASGAKLEGELQTNPFSNDYDEPVTGFFAIVKGNEGTLTIESRKDKAKRLLCHFRLLTPDVVKADASISAPLAAKRTLILSPEHPGDLFYGDFYKWNKFEGYLGLRGNILSGEIGSDAIFGTHVKLRFTMPSG